MKVVILAGGFGTRISEESHLKPKPMIEIGELPILVHIMKIYASQGFNDFIICAGYKQNIIKEYFNNYFIYNSDVTFDMSNNKISYNSKPKDKWKVTVVDTGLNTMTGGRLKRVQKYIGNEQFLLTYGDGVGDVNINDAIKFHNESKRIATITSYNFGQNKGVIDVDKNGIVKSFREKSDLDGDLINIGFMVFEPQVFNYLKDDSSILEHEPMHQLVKDNELSTYIHKGYWQCMDTLREKEKLEELWNSGKAPWKVWKD